MGWDVVDEIWSDEERLVCDGSSSLLKRGSVRFEIHSISAAVRVERAFVGAASADEEKSGVRDQKERVLYSGEVLRRMWPF